MKIGLAQINSVIGDLEGNVARCMQAISRAANFGAQLVIFPEMILPGYPPRDLLYDPGFIKAVAEATIDLATKCADGPPVVVGTVIASGSTLPEHPGLYNAAALLQRGEVELVAAKRLLPTYDVFYEERWFSPGPFLPPVEIAGIRLGFLICEDLWDEGYPIHPGRDLVDAGAEQLICLSASPYRASILERRLFHARRQGIGTVYVNMCGANDELIFDGRSFILDHNGDLVAQLPLCEEEVRVHDLSHHEAIEEDSVPREELDFRALILGIRDFTEKNWLEKALVGVSGGVDSAVVATLATEALGPERVTAMMIPSRFTDPKSSMSAEELTSHLGIHLETIALEELHRTTENVLGDLLDGGTTAENVQARLRSMMLMAYVNRYGGILLNTSNKTELSLGYATLYGDMAGSLCPIADLTKMEVYALARWINRSETRIPEFSLIRPPSAELKAGQVDPFDYPEVSPIMEALVHENRSNDALKWSEHKRWHMGVILKLREKSFGTGRLIPITKR